jgi:hypothetical protein
MTTFKNINNKLKKSNTKTKKSKRGGDEIINSKKERLKKLMVDILAEIFEITYTYENKRTLKPKSITSINAIYELNKLFNKSCISVQQFPNDLLSDENIQGLHEMCEYDFSNAEDYLNDYMFLCGFYQNDDYETVTDMIEKINDIYYIYINPNNTALDIIDSGEQIIIKDYLASDPDHIVIQIENNENSATLFNKKNFQHLLEDGLRYQCKKANSSLNPTNIIKNPVLFNLKSIGLYGFCNADDIKKIINNSDDKYYVLKKNGIIESVVTKKLLDNSGQYGLMSASHCQEGQGGILYTINNSFLSRNERNEKKILS